MIIHYNCTIGSFLLHYFLLIYHPYPPSFHEMIFTLVLTPLSMHIMCRAVSGSKGEGEVSTEDNLAYGLSEPRGMMAADYEIPDTMQPFPPGAPAQDLESVYEGVY